MSNVTHTATMPSSDAVLASVIAVGRARNNVGLSALKIANVKTRPPTAVSSGRTNIVRTPPLTVERPGAAISMGADVAISRVATVWLASANRLTDEVDHGIDIGWIDDVRPGQEVVCHDQLVADVVGEQQDRQV